MANMTHMEFQRELAKRDIPQAQAMLMTMMYERIIDLSQQLDTCANLLNEFATAVKGFADLREQDQERLKKFMRRGEIEGVSVKSESYEQ